MRTKVIVQRVTALERVIDGLAEELIESADEEVLQAARDLRMEPTSRGSAAFIGIKYSSAWQFSDFFELTKRQPQQARADGGSRALPPSGQRVGGRKKKSAPPGSARKPKDS